MASEGHGQSRSPIVHSMELEVVIEIPKGSRNKYEADHDTGEIWLDRMLFTATVYPTDYGFFPRTLGEAEPPTLLRALEPDPFRVRP